MSKLTDRITETLIHWCNVGASDIVVPHWYHGTWEMDVMKITGSNYIIEYEVKISKSDFKADFKKAVKTWRNVPGDKKHDLIANGKRANRFYFVVPHGLVAKEEVPKYAGLIYYTESDRVGRKMGYLETVKNAPIIHKGLFTDFRTVAKKISFREFYLRQDLRMSRKALKELRELHEEPLKEAA